MILGIMQPYFFPYLGYFSLIRHADRFIFFDTPQYIEHGWVNRNRVLKQDGSTMYITVPIRKTARETPIREIEISGTDWAEKIFGQLTAYKKRAPRYRETVGFLREVLPARDGETLSALNIRTTQAVCSYIGLERRFDVFSEMDLPIEPVNGPDEWALNITKALGGDVYVNPPGGMSFFDPRKYEAAGIDLQFLQSNLPPYVQRIGRFEPGLSVIDAMMFCYPEEILQMTGDYTILRKEL